MNKSASHLLSLLAPALLLLGCSDPSEGVEKARVLPSGGDQAAAAAPREAGEGAPPAGEAVAYAIAPESTIAFVGSNRITSQEGSFQKFSGTLTVAGGSLAPPSSIEIDLDSTTTGSDRLTRHLKNEDFFDVPTYPTSTFTLISARPMEGGKTEIQGELDLHGTVKTISFPAAVSIAPGEVSIEAEFTINRYDFGISYQGAGGDRLIRPEVVLRLAVRARP